MEEKIQNDKYTRIIKSLDDLPGQDTYTIGVTIDKKIYQLDIPSQLDNNSIHSVTIDLLHLLSLVKKTSYTKGMRDARKKIEKIAKSIKELMDV